MAENAVTMKWMMVSRIVIIWFWVIIIKMTLTFFQAWKSKKQVSMAARSRLGSAVDLAAIFLGYSLRAGVVKFYSSSGAAAALAAYSPRAAWTVAWGCWSNKTSSSRLSQFSCLHLVASYCQNNHLQASKNKSNDYKLCMISNFFNKILYIDFIILFKCLILESSPQRTWSTN